MIISIVSMAGPDAVRQLDEQHRRALAADWTSRSPRGVAARPRAWWLARWPSRLRRRSAVSAPTC